MPSFEFSVLREKSGLIELEARGIYRYRNTHGDIVYIGKGAIRNRFGLPERADWEFANIDYSPVSNEEDQFSWEAFWLDRYRRRITVVFLITTGKGVTVPNQALHRVLAPLPLRQHR